MRHRALFVGLLLFGLAAYPAAQTAPRAQRGSGSVAGRILHADGAAAEGARVAVYAIREGAPAGVVATATSAHDGRYEVTGLPAGQFAVGATPQRIRGFGGDSRRLPAAAVETLYPGTTRRTEARPITVVDGVPTEGIDLWLEPAAQRYSISGRVYWPEGSGVEKVALEFGGAGEVHSGIWYVTDPGGLFTIEGVSRGTYLLFARSDTEGGPLIGIAATDVATDSVHDVRLTLGAPGAIEGRLVVEGAAPVPSSARVVPRQMLLTLSPIYPIEEATVDASGQFTVANLLGDYTIAVEGLPAGWRVRRVTRAGAVVPENRLRVSAGQRIAGVEVHVGP